MSNLHDELIALKMAAESMPAPKEIRNILRLVSRGAPFDQLFFEQLNDPSWLPILHRFGYFSNLPGIQTIEGGRQVYPYHLPLIGLSRLAGKAPQAVSSILAKLELSENPTVGDQVLKCITLIREPTCIPILHPLLVQLGESPNRSSWVWIQELLNNWIDIKAFNDVLIVVNSYLLAAVGSFTNRSPMRDEWLVQQVDQNALEKLTSEYPLQIATIVFNSLSIWAEQQRKEQSGEKQSQGIDVEDLLGEDFPSSYWLEDFRTPPGYRELEGTLARRLFLAAEQVYRHGDLIKIELLDQLLRSHSWALFERLRWQLYVDFPSVNFERARKDVLLRIPFLNRIEFVHNYEFAHLLQAYAEQRKNAFLSLEEVKQLFDVVSSGPVDRSGKLIIDDYANIFQRRQLWPISSLLNNTQLAIYDALAPDGDRINIESYKPFRAMGGEAHFVQHVPPPEGNHLAAMENQQLWDFLNNWQPTGQGRTGPQFWVHEDIGALANKFGELLETEPKRFLAAYKWWENLNRPEPLLEPLNRAIERIKKKKNENPQVPTDNDWANWFGIAEWIASKSVIAKTEHTASERTNENRQQDWYWPRIVVTNFLTAALRSDYAEVNSHLAELIKLLRKMVEEDDVRLQADKGVWDEWLTMAINTVRGHAIEGVLELALRQKNGKEDISPWIFELISSRLSLPQESPAIFALVGSRLRLMIYLFQEQLKKMPSLIFPSDRTMHQRAAIMAHICFDHPMTQVVETFPDFTDQALSALARFLDETEDKNSKPRDFASQLGIHIAFYFWNNAFPKEDVGEAALDRFFATARSETRAQVINQIGMIFEKAEKTANPIESEKIFQRVMRIWERRYHQIIERVKAGKESRDDIEAELGQFLGWLDCESFPFEWRFAHAMEAFTFLRKVPDVFQLVKMLHDWNEKRPERLKQSLQILSAMLSRPNDQLRWHLRAEQISPMLIRGLNSEVEEIRNLAGECRDLLLKMGLFEFLEIANQALK